MRPEIAEALEKLRKSLPPFDIASIRSAAKAAFAKAEAIRLEGGTDGHGPARTEPEPDYAAMDAAMAGLDWCPHCRSDALDMFAGDGGVGYQVECLDCELASPVMDEPEEAADWWRRMGAGLVAEEAAAMFAALDGAETAPAFGGDVARELTVTVTMTRDQANALWALASQMIDGLECHMVADRPTWTSGRGARIVVLDQDLDNAARALVAVRESLNAAHRAAGDATGLLLALAYLVPKKAEG